MDRARRMMSSRVLLVTEQVRPGGKRSHVIALRAGLEAIGRPAEILDWAMLPFIVRAWIAGPTRLLNAMSPALGNRWAIPALGRAFAGAVRRRLGPEFGVVHVQEPMTFAGARAAAGRRPVAITVHGPVHREIASAYALPLEHSLIRWLREVEAAAYRDADAVIAVDAAHGEYVRGFGRTDRVWVIPNFVDTRRFHPGVVPTPLDATTAARVAGRPIILCPRRLVPKNGVAVAIRAMAALSAGAPPCVLVVLGTGPEGPALAHLVRELGAAERVVMLGDAAPDSMPAWCRRAAVIVVPSVPSAGVEEATSISVLEGQACGRPVVASALGGILELVRDGETGVLVPPGEAAALASALQRVLADSVLARGLGERAASHVAAHHSHTAGASAYAAVYDALTEPGGAPRGN